MAKAQQQPQKVGFKQRIRQIGMVFSFTAKYDRLFVPLVVVAAAVPLLAMIVLLVLGAGLLWLPVGLLLAMLGVLMVLNLRSNKAMLAQAAEQPGSSASLIQGMRGDWRVHPAFAATTQMDMVHVIIGRPGVILLGEGQPARVRALIGQEKRRLAKVIGTTELRDFVIGDSEGELALKKLRTTLMKLPRTLPGKDVNALDKRVTALSARPQMPRGAVPKNMRPPMPRSATKRR